MQASPLAELPGALQNPRTAEGILPFRKAALILEHRWQEIIIIIFFLNQDMKQ